MRALMSISALAGLIGCVAPATGPLPTGAIPFSQVLSENAGKPFECLDYDPQSRTCSGTGRYTLQADGTYLSEGLLMLEDNPRLIARAVSPAVEINGRLCSNGADIRLEVVEGQVDETTDFVLGFVEEVYRSLGQVCATYTPTGSGYSVELTAEGGMDLGDLTATSTFFATAPGLRVDL